MGLWNFDICWNFLIPNRHLLNFNYFVPGYATMHQYVMQIALFAFTIYIRMLRQSVLIAATSGTHSIILIIWITQLYKTTTVHQSLLATRIIPFIQIAYNYVKWTFLGLVCLLYYYVSNSVLHFIPTIINIMWGTQVWEERVCRLCT